MEAQAIIRASGIRRRGGHLPPRPAGVTDPIPPRDRARTAWHQ